MDGRWIGEAVQETRRRLQTPLDRRFGTPVLYLQEDGALLRPARRSEGDEPLIRQDGQAARSIKDELITICARSLRGPALTQGLQWVEGRPTPLMSRMGGTRLTLRLGALLALGSGHGDGIGD